MNLLHLKYFYTVAIEQSFTRAAQKLMVAQPSLSKMVKQLETELNLTLLDRTNREVHLTSDGKILFEHSQRIFNEVDSLKRVLKRGAVSTFEPMLIGATDVVAAHLIPNLFKTLQKRGTLSLIYPVVQTGTASHLCDLIERRKLEFGLFFHLPEVSSRLVVSPLAKVRFHLVANAKLRGDEDTLNRFIGSREVDEEGAKRFPTLEKWRKLKPNARIQISSNSLIAHAEMVRSGLGISVLPGFLIESDLKKAQLVDLLPNENLTFQLKLVTHSSYPLRQLSQEFIDLVKQEISV